MYPGSLVQQVIFVSLIMYPEVNRTLLMLYFSSFFITQSAVIYTCNTPIQHLYIFTLQGHSVDSEGFQIFHDFIHMNMLQPDVKML